MNKSRDTRHSLREEFAELQASSLRQLRRLELKLLDPEVRSDRDQLISLISDDFLEVGSAGMTYDKWKLIDMLVHEVDQMPVTVRGMSVELLSDDVGLVTYKSLGHSGQVRRSSVWVRKDGVWRIRFHQGTHLKGVWHPRG